jgi:hypothetical protein
MVIMSGTQVYCTDMQGKEEMDLVFSNTDLWSEYFVMRFNNKW